MSDRRRNVFVLLVVLGLLIASVVVILTQPTKQGLDLKGGVQLVYQGKPTPQQPKVDAGRARPRAGHHARARRRSSASPSPRSSAPAPTRSRSASRASRTPSAPPSRSARSPSSTSTTGRRTSSGADCKPHPADAEGHRRPVCGLTGLPEYQAVKLAAKRPPMNPKTATTGVQWYLVNDKTRPCCAGPERVARPTSFSERGPACRHDAWSRSTRARSSCAPRRPSAEGPAAEPLVRPQRQPGAHGHGHQEPRAELRPAAPAARPIVTFDFTDKGRNDVAQRHAHDRPARPRRWHHPRRPDPDCREFSQHFASRSTTSSSRCPYIDYRENPDGIDGATARRSPAASRSRARRTSPTC